MTADVAALLRAELGDRVDTSDSARAQAQIDKSGLGTGHPPLAVVHAASISDVQHTLRVAHRTGTPVVTRGAGTGLAGGATAGQGEIALSLLAMNRILEIRPDDLLAVVEPGVINGNLDAALREHGLWWPPDPASRNISTVGGNIASGAGGLLCAKYGVVRDAVLAVDVVLADGTLVHFGHRTVKGVTGMDLTSLMIGSEGTLGVIVGATVKLRRVVPGELCTIVATFPNVRQAARGSSAVTAAGIQPAIMELLDADALQIIHDHLRLDPPQRGTAQLTIQTDGAAAAAEAESIARILGAGGGQVQVTTDREHGEKLLHLRRSMHAAVAALGTCLIEDVSVPRSELAAMFDEIERISARYRIRIPTVAHAGDGNLHPNLVVPPGHAAGDIPDTVWAAADEMFRAALRLGGTLTGEHGVGVLKRRWLTDELGQAQWQLQRQIAAVFDPTGILNPGKVFDPTG